MRAHLEEIVGATGDIEGTGALIIHQPEEFVKEEHFGRFFIKLKWLYAGWHKVRKLTNRVHR